MARIEGRADVEGAVEVMQTFIGAGMNERQRLRERIPEDGRHVVEEQWQPEEVVLEVETLRQAVDDANIGEVVVDDMAAEKVRLRRVREPVFTEYVPVEPLAKRPGVRSPQV